MDDEWFIEQFQDVKERLTRIESKADQTNGNVKENKKDIEGNCKAIRKIQDSELVRETEEKFHKKHPKILAGGVTVGGVSLVTLIGLIIKVIIDMGVLG